MPSTSAKQAKFMRAVAHSPKFAKKVGVPQSVGKDYEMADKKKIRKFASAGKVGRSAQEGIDKALENINASTPKPDMKDDTIAKATAPQKAPSFAEAFREARKNALSGGPKTFTWGGKSYTTKLASEVKKPAAPTRTSTASAPARKAEAPKAADVSASTRSFMSKLPMAPKATTPPAVKATAAPAVKAADKPRKAVGVAAASNKPKAAAPKATPKAAAKPDWSKALNKTSPALLQRKKEEKPKPGSLLMKRTEEKPKPGSLLMKKAKGGSIDGCAIRGKTRAPMKKGK